MNELITHTLREGKVYMIVPRGHGIYNAISKDSNNVADTRNNTCTCRSWYYSKNPKKCKHLNMVRANYGLN